MEGCGEQVGVVGQLDDGCLAEDVDMGWWMEEGHALPHGIGAGMGIVVAGKNEDGEGWVGAEQVEDSGDQGLIDLVVLEQVAGDQEGVGMRAVGERKGGLQRGQAGGTQRGGLSAELGKPGTELPVCGVDETHHASRTATIQSWWVGGM